MKKEILRGIIYARVSTDMQGQESIENQIERCKNYIKDKKNISIEKIISDISTGGNEDRAGFKELIEKIENKEFDILIITELSRLSRTVITTLNILDKAKNNGIQVISVLQNIDTTTPTGNAMLAISSVFAQMERDNLKSRVKNTLDTIASSGVHTGGVAPFGYKLVNKKLEIDPDNSMIVKQLFEDFINGIPRKKICKKHGVKLTTLNRILSSETYLGVKVYGRRRVGSNGKLFNVSNDEIKKYPNSHPAIIDEETFHLVQTILNKGKEKFYRNRKRRKGEFLLYDIVKCYNGHTMYGGITLNKTKYRFYNCCCHNNGSEKICPKKNVGADKLEESVINDILNLDIEKVDIEKSKAFKENELKRIEEEFDKYSERKKRSTDLFIEGTITKEELNQKLKGIEKELSRLKSKKFLIEQEIKEYNDMTVSYSLIQKVAKKLAKSQSFEEKQKLLHLIIEKVQFINDFEYELVFKV